jgi:hypothetical protein
VPSTGPLQKDGTQNTARSKATRRHTRGPIPAYRQAAAKPPPIVFIDGIRATVDQMRSLDRTQVNTGEVIKGRAAVSIYGAEAKDGVIVATTKRDGVG